MIKLGEILKNKLFLQAEEAKEQGMEILGDAILETISTETAPNETYSYSQMNKEIHSDLWKVAARLMKYYDVQSLDIEKLDMVIASWSDKLVEDLEISLQMDERVKGSSDPKLPGEY